MNTITDDQGNVWELSGLTRNAHILIPVEKPEPTPDKGWKDSYTCGDFKHAVGLCVNCKQHKIAHDLTEYQEKKYMEDMAVDYSKSLIEELEVVLDAIGDFPASNSVYRRAYNPLKDIINKLKGETK